jgi:hypothetical protein
MPGGAGMSCRPEQRSAQYQDRVWETHGGFSFLFFQRTARILLCRKPYFCSVSNINDIIDSS